MHFTSLYLLFYPVIYYADSGGAVKSRKEKDYIAHYYQNTLLSLWAESIYIGMERNIENLKEWEEQECN